MPESRIPPALRTVGIPLLVGFAVTLGLTWQRLEHNSGEAGLSAPQPVRKTTLLQPGARSAVSDPGPEPAKVAVQAQEAPKEEAPAADPQGPELPLMFGVSSRPGTPDEDDENSGSPSVQRQVNLLNQSDKPLTIWVLITDPATGEHSEKQFFVPPHQQAHVASSPDLKLEPGYQVALRSSGFQELTQTVN